MKTSAKLVTIKGISFYVHFTFLIFIAWLLVLYIMSGMQWEQLLWSLVFIISLFTCVMLHEYGHALTAAQFGISAKKITLYPIGGIASIEKLPENPRQELLISMAGPAVSFVIGGVLLLFAPQHFTWHSLREYTGVLSSSNFLYTLGVVNIVLAVFNLIPAFPMDGGRIFRALLAFKYNYLKATVIAASVGRAIAILIVIAGIISLNLLMSVIGIFIILFAQAEESYLQIKMLVKNIHLNDVLMYDYDSIDAGLNMIEAANILSNNHSKYFIVVDKGMPVGVLNRMAVMKVVADQEFDTKVGELMKETPEHFEGAMLVEDVLDKFAVNDERIFPVFDKEKFIGVVNFQHIIEYLLIHKSATREFVKTRSLAGLV
jgi:Zn-dependent protease